MEEEPRPLKTKALEVKSKKRPSNFLVGRLGVRVQGGFLEVSGLRGVRVQGSGQTGTQRGALEPLGFSRSWSPRCSQTLSLNPEVPQPKS